MTVFKTNAICFHEVRSRKKKNYAGAQQQYCSLQKQRFHCHFSTTSSTGRGHVFESRLHFHSWLRFLAPETRATMSNLVKLTCISVTKDSLSKPVHFLVIHPLPEQNCRSHRVQISICQSYSTKEGTCGAGEDTLTSRAPRTCRPNGVQAQQ